TFCLTVTPFQCLLRIGRYSQWQAATLWFCVLQTVALFPQCLAQKSAQVALFIRINHLETFFILS
ncbi:hypothetical protein, partial [Sutcliffiella cohnii]|uniref:hypothetical protein n=1 Tax=Sutcliffiella cohnii TaxID=33932 RepID=UPI002E229F49|nr:hypothetical protein [Sutcliffiella cohnii]